MKKSIILLAVAEILMLSGCNTIHGIGKDLGRVGEAIGKS
jgi:predicted small secreted protein